MIILVANCFRKVSTITKRSTMKAYSEFSAFDIIGNFMATPKNLTTQILAEQIT